MAQVIIEIYVSLDGVSFHKLDLDNNESINRKEKRKDLQDLSKIFAPFSQDFVFPATTKNREILGFFGDTDVIKINSDNKYKSKLYIGGILNQTGYLKVSKLAYKNNKPTDFTGSFVSNMTNLKSKIGDDLLSELTTEEALVSWGYKGVQDMVRSNQTINVDGVDIRYFVPLVSVNRVWGYDTEDNNTLLDNIAFNPSNDVKGNKVIRPEELRPVIYYSSIMNLIKKKYDLDIISPLEDREEYKDLTVWCNSERIVNNDYKRLPIFNSFNSFKIYGTKNFGLISRYMSPLKYTIQTDTTNYTFTVTKNESANRQYRDYFNFTVTFNGVVVTGGTEEPEVNVRYFRVSDSALLKEETFKLEGNKFKCLTKFDDEVFGSSDVLSFYIEVQFMQPSSWSTCDFKISNRYYTSDVGLWSKTAYAWIKFESLANYNSNQIKTDNIDLIKALPKVKVVDFLTSHIKSFNISVFDTSPDNDKLYWLTPEDVDSEGFVYSKDTLDYTPYVDIEEKEKERPNEYNYYNFKHAESEYFSNKKYLEATGVEYGQITYPSEKPKDLNEFKVETDFSIIPPVSVQGATGLVTAYGFTNDQPETLSTGETRYTPNYDELTLFYSHGSTECSTLSYLGLNTSNQPYIYPLTGYMKVMPFSKNKKSLVFSILVFNSISIIDTLYKRYYENQTIRLLNPNVLAWSFDLNLPPSEIYLNESTTQQGKGAVPSGFRLQNDIIIGENKFSIVESTIDITTGKSKMTLLNY